MLYKQTKDIEEELPEKQEKKNQEQIVSGKLKTECLSERERLMVPDGLGSSVRLEHMSLGFMT